MNNIEKVYIVDLVCSYKICTTWNCPYMNGRNYCGAGALDDSEVVKRFVRTCSRDKDFLKYAMDNESMIVQKYYGGVKYE